MSFNFSLLRLGAYAITVVFFSYLPYFRRKADSKDHGKLPYLAIGVLGSALFIFVMGLIISDPLTYLTSYPIAQEELHAHTSLSTGKTDIFVSLFDAFGKGRIDLDLAVDPKLLALENPWNPSERSAARVSYYWDHAFYGGKYYSYYGPLPVILISFPLYFLSLCRYVPTAFGLEIIGMSFLIPSFFLLTLEIFKTVQKKVNYPQYILFSCLGLITSMTIMAATWKDGYYHEAIYHVPDIYGLTCFDLFLAMTLQAYRNKQKRFIPLGFAGLFFVFVILSRPNLFLGLALALPFFLAILFEKGVKWKKKAREETKGAH